MMKKYIVSFALLILSISVAQAQSQYSSEYNQCMDKAAGLWLQYREANCKFYDDPEGGSMQRILANDCFLRMTAERAEELNSLHY
jgi:uncharacterized protein YecT (DUF1311 family)